MPAPQSGDESSWVRGSELLQGWSDSCVSFWLLQDVLAYPRLKTTGLLYQLLILYEPWGLVGVIIRSKVPVPKQLNTTPWRCMGEWTYRFTWCDPWQGDIEVLRGESPHCYFPYLKFRTDYPGTEAGALPVIGWNVAGCTPDQVLLWKE
jgi:hypothetical protein